MPTWRDPVKSLHMREKSDVVFIYSGKLMKECNVELWQSKETKDFITPVIVYYGCLVSVRSRESGEMLTINTDALNKSGLEKHPAQ